MARMWDLDDLVGASDIAKRYGERYSTISNWVARYSDFPKELLIIGGKKVWSRKQVHAWWKAVWTEDSDSE